MIAFWRATYAHSQKSARSDEWINTWCIRPVASIPVWIFYRLRWKPVWVVWLGCFVGTLAAVALLVLPAPIGLPTAGGLLLVKNVLDAADGQLARATGTVDRIGRFSDSIADFWVNVLICVATARVLPASPAVAWPVGALTALFLLLQCSLFVFYQVKWLEEIGRSGPNRSDESPPLDALEGRTASRLERRLHAVFLFLYGWQDRWMAHLDRALRGGVDGAAWYGDAVGLRISSFLGLGTSLSAYGLLLLVQRPELAVCWIWGIGGTIAIATIVYRGSWLRPRIRRRSTCG